MSLENRRVVLALTLTPVGPRKQSLDGQVLALHIAAAYHPGSLPKVAEMSEGQVAELRALAQKELLPWVWGPETLTVLAMPVRDVTPPAGAVLPLVLQAEVLPAGRRTPVLMEGGAAAVRKSATEAVTNMPPTYLLWDPDEAMAHDDGAAVRPSRLIEDLAALSTLWGGVPEALGVTLYFKVKRPEQSQLTSQDFAMIAAPHYRDAARQHTAVPATDFRFFDPMDGGNTAKWQHGWEYSGQSQWPRGPKEISALSKPLVVHPSSPSSELRFDNDPMAAVTPMALGLDFGTYWVHTMAAKPWLDRLDPICAQLADPFTRLCGIYKAVQEPSGPEQRAAWQRLLLLAAASAGLWPLRAMQSGQTKPDRELVDGLQQLLSLPSFDPLQREVDGLLAELAEAEPLLSGEPRGLQRFLSVVRVGMGGAALADEADRATVHAALAAAVEALISRPGQVDLVCLWACEHVIEKLRKRGGLGPLAAGDAARLTQELRALLGLPPEGAPEAEPEETRRGPLYLRRQATGRLLRECAAQLESPTLRAPRDAASPDPVAEAALKWFTVQLSEQPDRLRLGQLLPDAQPDSIHTGVPASTKEQWSSLFWEPIKEQYEAYVARALRKLHDEILAPDVPEALPGGLTVQLDLPAADAGQDAAADDDSWRKLAGIGMLVRRAGAGNRWHLASAARVLWQEAPGARPGLSLFDAPAVVPARLGHSGGEGTLRCPVLTYSQRSLIAANPLAEAAGRGFEIERTAATGQDIDAAFTYEPVLSGSGAELDRYKLLRLRFGQSYEVACFMVDTAGGLPDKLTAGGQAPLPYAFRPDWPRLDQAAGPADFPMVTIPYFRRVPVGELRLCPGRSGPRAQWPSVPAGCQPLLWEVEPQQPTKQAASRAPLILLDMKSDASFAFRIQPPSTDREVLERWGLPAPHERESLKQILTGYFEALGRLAGASEEALKEGLSLDDPAVTAIRIKVECFGWGADNRATGWTTKLTRDLAVDRATDRVQMLLDYQHPGLVVSCKVGEQLGLSEGAPYELTVPRGALVRLRVHALVPTRFVDGPEARFASFLFTDREGCAPLPHDAQHYELPPVELLIEAASEELPAPWDLWNGLSLSCSEFAAGDPQAHRAIEVRLAPRSSGNAELGTRFRNIARVELIMQQWRWTGRPQAALPTELRKGQAWPVHGVPEPDLMKPAEYQEWELKAFAGLSPDQESLRVPIPYVKGMWQSAEGVAPDPIWKEEITDHRAQLWRFAVRVHSRYTPLLAAAARSVASKVDAEDDDPSKLLVSLDGWLWKRAFFPFQPSQPFPTSLHARVLATPQGAAVPRPLVKAVIPLTAVLADFETVDSSAGDIEPELASPLLVVLDGAAFSSCGITERIEARIATVETPDSETPPSTYHQYGPDPIVSVDATPYRGSGTGTRPEFRDMMGPIGYTFDTDARQEFYAHSAYVLPPFTGAKPWDFALISLCRRSGNDPVDGEAELSWTAPLWVQFPPSADFASFADDKGRLAPRWDAGSTSIVFSLRAKLPDRESGPRTHYWVILTTQIADYSGQLVEKYEGVAQLKPESARSWKTVGTVLDKPHLVRLVEIQSSNPPSTEPLTPTNFWHQFLPEAPAGGKAPADVSYRIVRVSQGIPLADTAGPVLPA